MSLPRDADFRSSCQLALSGLALLAHPKWQLPLGTVVKVYTQETSLASLMRGSKKTIKPEDLQAFLVDMKRWSEGANFLFCPQLMDFLDEEARTIVSDYGGVEIVIGSLQDPSSSPSPFLPLLQNLWRFPLPRFKQCFVFKTFQYLVDKLNEVDIKQIEKQTKAIANNLQSLLDLMQDSIDLSSYSWETFLSTLVFVQGIVHKRRIETLNLNQRVVYFYIRQNYFKCLIENPTQPSY